MPFHDQPGLARAARTAAAANTRLRVRQRVTTALAAMPGGALVEQVAAHAGLGYDATVTALNLMVGDGAATRTRVSKGLARRWRYTLTPGYQPGPAPVPLSAKRRAGQAGQAETARARTRTAILAALNVWPNAHTARYIADHIGMSVSAVNRALPALTDTGQVLWGTHPFNRNQRVYWLPPSS